MTKNNSSEELPNGNHDTEEPGEWTTKTLTLAAYLHSRGHDFMGTERGNGDTVFRFIKTSQLLGDVRQFRMGKATGNINSYESSRHHMLGLVKGS